MSELPHSAEYRDAIAMTLALERGDKQMWSALFLPYVERFNDGERQPMANLVSTLSGVISNLGKQLAEIHGLTFERALELYAFLAAHEGEDPFPDIS